MNIESLKAIYNFKRQLKKSETKVKTGIQDLNFLFENYGGYSLENGVFRIHNFETSRKWTDIVCETFPKYTHKILVYGFDWYGRQYAKDLDKNFTYMFDIATGEDYELEQELSDFFITDLIEYAQETLNLEEFKVWNSNNLELDFDKVVAFKIPLWLGGNDSIDNYEITDAEVNWEINRQLMNK